MKLAQGLWSMAPEQDATPSCSDLLARQDGGGLIWRSCAACSGWRMSFLACWFQKCRPRRYSSITHTLSTPSDTYYAIPHVPLTGPFTGARSRQGNPSVHYQPGYVPMVRTKQESSACWTEIPTPACPRSNRRRGCGDVVVSPVGGVTDRCGRVPDGSLQEGSRRKRVSPLSHRILY